MDDVVAATGSILENMSHIKIRVGQQAIMKMFSDIYVNVSYARHLYSFDKPLLKCELSRKMITMWLSV